MIRWGSGRRSFSARRAGVKKAAFSPLSLSPAIWYDPSDASTLFQTGTRGAPGTAAASTNPVGLMLDKSGNNLDATGTTTQRPTVFLDGASRPCLRGDGVANILAFLPSLALMKDFTLVIGDISQRVAAGANCAISLTTTANDQVIYDNSGSLGFAVYDGASRSYETASSQGLVRVLTYRCTDSSQSLRINTVANATAVATVTTTWTGTPTGGLFASSKYSQFAQCDIYGVLLFAGALSAGNRALVETYMGAKMGLTL